MEIIAVAKALLELLGAGGVWSVVISLGGILMLAGVGLYFIFAPAVKAFIRAKDAEAAQARAIADRVARLESDIRSTNEHKRGGQC